ncbi:MAG: hypothetical protein ACE5GO_05985 [Anaerolineales bacterium]
MSAILKLLRLRVRLWWNTIKHGSWGRKIGLAIALMGMIGIAFFLAFASWWTLRILSNPNVTAAMEEAGFEGALGGLLDQLPIFFSAGAFILGVLANFGILLQGLYLSGDMEFLLAAPLPARSVFLSKLVQAVFPNLVLLGLISGPALFGLGLAQGYNILYFLLVPVVLTLLVVCGAGLSSLLIMAVVRVVSPRRAAEVLGLVGGLAAFICSQSGQFSSSFKNISVSSEQLSGIAGVVGVVTKAWNPLTWPGRGLSAIGQGRWLAGLGFTGLTLVVTLGLFAITLTTAERLYFSGWARVQVGGRRKRRRKKRCSQDTARGARPALGVGARLGGLLPTPVRAVILKDARLYRRDIRNLSQLIFPIILAVVWTISLLREGGDKGVPVQVRSIIFSMGSLGIALFMGWMFVMRFGMGGFSMEGRQWWIVKIAPIRPAHLVLAKYLVVLLPSSGLGVVYLLAAALIQGVSPGVLLYQITALVMIVAAQSSLALAFGIWGARFDWTNPNEITGGMAGCFGSFAGMTFMEIAAGVIIGLPLLTEEFNLPRIAGFGGGLLLGLVLCLGVGIIPLWFAVRKLPHLGEGKD